jgi:L-alanine-DL-glutamate epimerase-like enolase superfamily enzyme
MDLNIQKTASNPSKLRITDMKIAEIHQYGNDRCNYIVRIDTNQGISGYGEVRDGASPLYAQMLKRVIIGENPCNIDKIFRRITQFGGRARQAGGVCAVEIALWDLVGRVYGIPIWQMLGGQFRDRIRIYCDTDVDGKDTPEAMAEALQKRMDDNGYTFLKMDIGIDLLVDVPGALTAPLGWMEQWDKAMHSNLWEAPEGGMTIEARHNRINAYSITNTAHPMTGVHVTKKGLEVLEERVKIIRDIIGYDVPLATDHFGHLGVEDCIAIAQQLDGYGLAWYEDMIPWQMTDQWIRLANSCTTPVCTGEDCYLLEDFQPLLDNHAVGVIHPDILSAGGILETKKIGDYAQKRGVAMCLHMAETPVAALACVQAAAATENFMALEFHSQKIVDRWSSLVTGLSVPLIQNGYIDVPYAPGLGFDGLNEDLIRELDPKHPKNIWQDTDQWNDWFSHDRLWS